MRGEPRPLLFDVAPAVLQRELDEPVDALFETADFFSVRSSCRRD
jgi:hypothetical protein